MAERTLRLFFGVPLPPELREALGRWQQAQPVERWSRPEGLHLTLAFLGERPAAALPGLAARAAAVAGRHGPFEVRTAGLGGFPGDGRARILWLGLAPAPDLGRLATDLRETLATAGEAMDPKPFRPHLTLARFRRPKDLSAFAAPPAAPFPVDRLILFESRPPGCYTPVQAWSLRTV
jgi:2'-5' RNA ligase